MSRSGSQISSSRRRRRRQQVMHVFSQHMATLFVLVSLILHMLSCFTEGRSTVPSQAALSHVQGVGEEEAKFIRSQIGSRPPRCAGRCYSCGHCEAIQVPTNPQVAKLGKAGVLSTTTGVYLRGDYGSNYKPMSWKCKCGNSIFNP